MTPPVLAPIPARLRRTLLLYAGSVPKLSLSLRSMTWFVPGGEKRKKLRELAHRKRTAHKSPRGLRTRRQGRFVYRNVRKTRNPFPDVLVCTLRCVVINLRVTNWNEHSTPQVEAVAVSLAERSADGDAGAMLSSGKAPGRRPLARKYPISFFYRRFESPCN